MGKTLKNYWVYKQLCKHFFNEEEKKIYTFSFCKQYHYLYDEYKQYFKFYKVGVITKQRAKEYALDQLYKQIVEE